MTLSLLADDWRQNREIRVAESELLGALAADLIEDSSSLAVIQSYTTRIDTTALGVSRVLSASESAPSEAYLRSIFHRLYSRRHYEPVRAAYLGARDAGQLGLIDDPDLREMVVEYYEFRQPIMQQLQSQTFTMRELSMELALPYFRFDIDQAALSYRDVSGLAFDGVWSEFRNTPGMCRRLDMFGIEAANWHRYTSQMLGQNIELRDRISRHLGRIR